MKKMIKSSQKTIQNIYETISLIFLSLPNQIKYCVVYIRNLFRKDKKKLWQITQIVLNVIKLIH